MLHEYISRLRSLIGHGPLLLVAAGVIIYDGRKVLLQKRADNGCWAIHGGALELGETVEEAAARELKEELGITPAHLRFYKVFSGEDMHVFYPNGDEVYCVNVIFLCNEYFGQLKTDGGEVSDFAWFDVYDLPENLNAPIDRAILKDYIISFRKEGDWNGSC